MAFEFRKGIPGGVGVGLLATFCGAFPIAVGYAFGQKVQIFLEDMAFTEDLVCGSEDGDFTAAPALIEEFMVCHQGCLLDLYKNARPAVLVITISSLQKTRCVKPLAQLQSGFNAQLVTPQGDEDGGIIQPFDLGADLLVELRVKHIELGEGESAVRRFSKQAGSSVSKLGLNVIGI